MRTATQRKKAQSLRRSVQTVRPGWARFSGEFFCLIKRFQRFQKPWCIKSCLFFAQLIDANWLNYSTRLGAKVRTLDSGARVKTAKKQVQNGHMFIGDLACLKTGEAVPSRSLGGQTANITSSKRLLRLLAGDAKRISCSSQSTLRYCINQMEVVNITVYISVARMIFFQHKNSYHSHHCSCKGNDQNSQPSLGRCTSCRACSMSLWFSLFRNQ